MGLDMYLTKKAYVSAKYDHANVTGVIDIKENGKPIPINFKRVCYIEEEVGYWRKANQIHKWFVENVQKGVDDCGTYAVEEGELKELLSLCHRVKEASLLKDSVITNGYSFENGIKMPILEGGKEIVNQKVAEKLLPTEEGFFFGNTDYNQYYMEDIDDTIKIIEGVLSEKEPGKDYLSAEIYYHSSW